ncbi:MAG: hypothetical protein HGA45_00200 [Chloroflexales bacterium]|nr:hypothetical protein [Chloroflexales bacterium]
MRFPLLDKLDLPCVFEQLVPGEPHLDGRRYLPLLLLRPTRPAGILPPGMLLAVVDRHHRVDEGDVGRSGVARLVFALSALRVQSAPLRQGLAPEPGWRGGASANPVVLGQVVEVGAWEVTRGQLPYEALYAELSLDIGLGIVGTRTSLTASDLEAELGKARVEPGDYIELTRSRIDILGFEPAA